MIERTGGTRGQEIARPGRAVTRRGLITGALALTAAVGVGRPSIAVAQVATPAPTPTPVPTTSDSDDGLNLKALLAAARIELRSEGVQLGSFSDVISVAPESAPVTYLDDDGKVQENPDQMVPPSIVLGDGTAGRELRAWFSAVRTADKPVAAARPSTLVLYDDDDRVITRYRLLKSLPAALRLANTSTQEKLDVQRLRMVFREIQVLES